MLKKHGKKIVCLLVLCLLITLTCLFSGRLISLIKDVDSLRSWLDRFGILQYLVFILLVSVQVILAVIPGGPYQVAGGYLYGTFLGSALCVIGCSLGSMIVFLLVRKYGHQVIRLFISEKSLEKARFITESKKSHLLLAICFIIPGTPKDAISYIAGLTTIPLWQWAIICSIGRLPGILLSVFAGQAFSKNNYYHAVIAFAMLAVICIIGALVYRKIQKQESPDS